jgi:transcriptional regulator with XRE-family HTH domain
LEGKEGHVKKIAKVLSPRIKALRERARLSQQDLAQRADLSLSQVAKLEQGAKADPRASTLLALAAALGVRPGELLDDLLPPGEDGREKLPKEERRALKRQAKAAKKAPKRGRPAGGEEAGHADAEVAPAADAARDPGATRAER